MSQKAFLGITLFIITSLSCSPRPLSHEDYIKCRQAILKELARSEDDRRNEYFDIYEHPLKHLVESLLYSRDSGRYVREARMLRNKVKGTTAGVCDSLGFPYKQFDAAHRLYGRNKISFSDELIFIDPRVFELGHARRIMRENNGVLRGDGLIFGRIVLACGKGGKLTLDGYPVSLEKLPSLLECYTPPEVTSTYMMNHDSSTLPNIDIYLEEGVTYKELWSILAMLKEQGKKQVYVSTDRSQRYELDITDLEKRRGDISEIITNLRAQSQ